MKIKVLSCFYGACPYEDIFLRSIKEYCEKWNYEFIYDRRDETATSNPYFEEDWFWWRNYTMILENLDDSDYVMWIDTDCIILNMRMPVETIVKKNTGDMIVVMEERPETGAFIVKNSKWTRQFFKKWKEYGEKMRNHSGDIKGSNNYIAFQKIVKWYPVEGHIRFVKDSEFMVKHVKINNRTDNTLLMHVPGSPFADKIYYMTEHSKQVTR
jgi:hypothetical protein